VVNSANGEHPTGLLAGWRKLSSRLLVATRWIRVLRDQVRVPNGELTYTYVEHPGSVFVVPVTRDGRVALIRSYRYPVDEWCWEVPAGALHDKAGRSLEEIARAEMFEEAGCAGGDLQALGSYWTANGVLRLKTHYFLARGAEPVGERAPEVGEAIAEVKFLPASEAFAWARDGRIADGESAFALLLAEAALVRS
jgi:ADP-ribose pyrophosphatase